MAVSLPISASAQQQSQGQRQAQPQIKSELTPVRATRYSQEGEMTDLLQNIIVAANRPTQTRLPDHAQRSHGAATKRNRTAKRREAVETDEPRGRSKRAKKSKRGSTRSKSSDSIGNEDVRVDEFV